MIAIRSRVDAPACTERSHLSRDWLSTGAIVGPRSTVESDVPAIEPPAGARTSSSSRITAGDRARHERTLPPSDQVLPRLYVGTVSQPVPGELEHLRVADNVAPSHARGDRRRIRAATDPSRPSSTTTSCPSLVKARAVDSPAKPAPPLHVGHRSVWHSGAIRVPRSLTYHIPET